MFPHSVVGRLVMAGFPLLMACAHLSTAHAQGTTFTYQGRLNDSNGPASGMYDFRFSLHDLSSGGAVIAGPTTHAAIAVSNGLFTATLDFGAIAFNGSTRWLEIAVRTNGTGAFIAVSPRQSITSTPYAITARNITGTLPGGGLAGVYTNSVSFSNAANSFTGSGAGLTSVNASTLGGLGANQFWRTSGNAGTGPTNFLGTSDNQPLELRINGRTALRLQPGAFGGPSVIGGSNTVHPLTAAATIAGGQGNQIRENGVYSTIGGGLNNLLDGAQYTTIAGGLGNRINPGVLGSVVSGGWENFIDESVSHSVIAGGHTNSLGSLVQFSTISGGERNRIHSTNFNAVIGGGGLNQIAHRADYSSIGGGFLNAVGTNAWFATIPGGYGNVARSPNSFAAGTYAHAIHPGAFVWGDGNFVPFSSTAANQFSVRAGGGVRLVTEGAGLSVDGNVGVGLSSAPQAPLHVSTPGEGIRVQGQAGDHSNIAWITFVNGSGTHIGYVGDGSTGDNATYLASYVGDVVLYTPAGPALRATTNGDVRLGPSGNLSPAAGEENLRIVRGEVAGNGIILKGSGFTVTHGPITGIYTITFATPFLDRPTITATADLQGGGSPYASMLVESASSTTVKLQARNLDAQALTQSRFHFIAIGPR